MNPSLSEIHKFLDANDLEMTITLASSKISSNVIDVEIRYASTGLVSHAGGGLEKSPEYYIMLAIQKAIDTGKFVDVST